VFCLFCSFLNVVYHTLVKKDEYINVGVGVSSLVVECRTRNFQVTGSNLTAGHLQAPLSKLLTHGVLRSTQPPTLRGTGNE